MIKSKVDLSCDPKDIRPPSVLAAHHNSQHLNMHQIKRSGPLIVFWGSNNQNRTAQIVLLNVAQSAMYFCKCLSPAP